MQDFRQVEVWKKAHLLVLKVYRISESLPPSENFGLKTHLRRSATAVATRIAEGTGKDMDLEFAVDLRKARAGGHEVEYLLLLAHDLGYLPEGAQAELTKDIVEIRKMISGLLKKIPQ